MSQKLIVVLGATGAQGGSLVDALLEDGGYKVKGVTRNPDSAKSKALIERGVEMVKADFNDSKSCEDLFAGAYGAYALTNFWDPASMGKEHEQGKRLADAAKKAGVKHFIWSTLANVEKYSKGKYHVPHFTDKALVDDYIKEIGLPHTFAIPACYYQNFAVGSFVQPQKQEDGSFTMTLNIRPDSPVALFDVRDTGKCLVPVFNNPDKWLGKAVFMVGDNLKCKDIWGNEEIQKQVGGKVNVNHISLEEYAKLGFPGAEELANMWGWFDEFQYGGPEYSKIIGSGREAFPGMKTYVEYAKDVNLKFA